MSTRTETVSHLAAPSPNRFSNRFELSDVLVCLYILVFVRQYFWIISNNGAAWTISAILSLAITYLYVISKPFASERPGWRFWLVITLPLLLIYLLRVPFPDLSFDVLNYRLVHGERSLRGTLFMPGDFFPTPAPYNPAPDTLTGLFRLALGYRFGTIINLLILIWTAVIVDKMLAPFVRRQCLRAVAVLLVLLAEQPLFEINTYLIDLLSVPLILEVTYLALRFVDHSAQEDGRESFRSIWPAAALLLGLSAGLKLTNLIMIAPLIIVLIYGLIKTNQKPSTKQLIVGIVVLAAPLLPFTIYLWRLTGNPVFPIANTFFKSPFWPTNGGWDMRWGPHGIVETLVWPLLVMVHPERHSELAVYSGRLTIGFLVALVALLTAWRQSQLRLLALLLILDCFSWSATSLGYSRYGLYLEILSGVVVIACVTILVRENQQRWKPVIAFVFLIALLGQALVAVKYVLRYEWSMRPTLLSNPAGYKQQARYMFRDRHLNDFLTDDQRALWANAGAWIQSSPKSSALEVLLRNDIPIVSVDYGEYFATRHSQKQFVETVERSPNQPMYSLCFPEDLLTSEELIRLRGLETGPVMQVEVPFFSQQNRIRMMLVPVSLPKNPQVRQQFDNSWRKAPFADRDYRAAITTSAPLTTLHAGEQTTLTLRVVNEGNEIWPAHGDEHGMYQVNIGDRWLDSSGSQVVNDLDGRAALPFDLQPSGQVQLSLKVTAPRAAGQYILEIDMIHEAVTFFHEKGSKTLRMVVTVEP